MIQLKFLFKMSSYGEMDDETAYEGLKLAKQPTTSVGYKARTERGKRMAASIAEYILMRYFFPEIYDRKKLARYQDDFVRDMNFSLKTGLVTSATKKLHRIPEQMEYFKIFNNLHLGIDISKQEEAPFST